MAFDLAGQVAIITGASSGLGYAVAKVFAKHGAKLVLTARREERLIRLRDEVAQLGAEAIIVPGDGSHEATAQAVIRSALDAFGTIDILINNAGAGFYKPFLDTSVDEFDALVNSNLRSSFVFSRHALPHLVAQGSGTVLFVSSIAGLAGPANEAVYAATKFAQTGFAQSLDAEFRSHGIKVAVIHPGGMKTEFAVGHGRDAASVASSHMMEPNEVAELIAITCALPRNISIPQMTIRHMG